MGCEVTHTHPILLCVLNPQHSTFYSRVKYAYNASFYQQDISGCVDEAAVYTREKDSGFVANPVSSEVYDSCEPPDHA